MDNQYTFQTLEVDLENCDQEPIHIPNLIQPHGLLLVVKESDLTILQISKNIDAFLGIPAQELLGKKLDIILENSYLKEIQALLSQKEFSVQNPIKLELKTQKQQILTFDTILHRTEGGVILELEPELTTGEIRFLNFYDLIRNSIVKLQNSLTLQELSERVTQEIRRITGFDRVMLYRFNPEGHGKIIAEDKQDALPTYLGLQYPASDVPKQARKLYCLNWLRLIPDANYQPSAIIPPLNPITHEPLDLSQAILRSVSLMHIEYLQNMGVTASMSISLIKNQQLWGLVACHHYSPKYIPYEVRKACEFLGQVMSVELITKEQNEDYDYRLKIKDIQTQILESMSMENNFVDGLITYYPNLLDLVNATGVLISFEGKYTTLGKTPAPKELEDLIQWLLENHAYEDIFYTDSLTSHFEKAEKFKETASGLLAIPLSKMPQNYLLWFRPEEVQTITWAGNPHKPVQLTANGTPRLTPRGSFELWKETVRGKSIPWQPCEIEAAQTLRGAIVKVVLRQADELANLNAALKKSEAQSRQKNEQLTQTIETLKHTQTKLIQSEKMSSLGQLVAGVAHEINNPINFIYGNILHASEYTKDLLHLIEVYNSCYPSPDELIQEEKETIDFEFLVEDLPKLLNSMQVGAERIRDIVKSLRTFSRLDEAEKKAVDIHEGIDSTLLILQYRLKNKQDKAGIEVIKQYGDLPLVECYPGQLNQVLMNLIANAIDAIESELEIDSFLSKNHQIIIRTEITDTNFASICVSDNGPGISEEIQQRIFDPLFTTKPVGKGTGIGLAISYQIIVEKHGGRLNCYSQPGIGTDFVIEIPMQQL